MPLFQKKENKVVETKDLATRSGNASGYQKTEEYQKGDKAVQKTKILFDDGHGTAGKTKLKSTTKVTELASQKDSSAVSALTERRRRREIAVLKEVETAPRQLLRPGSDRHRLFRALTQPRPSHPSACHAKTKVDGNKTETRTNVQSNYSFSATLSGTPKEIEKQKKKMKKDMKKRKKEMKKEQERLLKQGQKNAYKK